MIPKSSLIWRASQSNLVCISRSVWYWVSSVARSFFCLHRGRVGLTKLQGDFLFFIILKLLVCSRAVDGIGLLFARVLCFPFPPELGPTWVRVFNLQYFCTNYCRTLSHLRRRASSGLLFKRFVEQYWSYLISRTSSEHFWFITGTGHSKLILEHPFISYFLLVWSR